MLILSAGDGWREKDRDKTDVDGCDKRLDFSLGDSGKIASDRPQLRLIVFCFVSQLSGSSWSAFVHFNFSELCSNCRILL